MFINDIIYYCIKNEKNIYECKKFEDFMKEKDNIINKFNAIKNKSFLSISICKYIPEIFHNYYINKKLLKNRYK